ncbi:hypothetical protein BDW69DRAFT_190292 [Aspergillus filifer]
MQFSMITIAFSWAMCLCLFTPLVSAYSRHLQRQNSRQHQPPHEQPEKPQLSRRQNSTQDPTPGLHTPICAAHAQTAPRDRVAHAQWVLHTLGAGESPIYAGGPYEVWDHMASQVGPGDCADVYCYQGVMVYWCNDGKDIRTMNLVHIAASVQVLLNDCEEKHEDGKGYVGGELKHTADTWRVTVVKDDKCGSVNDSLEQKVVHFRGGGSGS